MERFSRGPGLDAPGEEGGHLRGAARFMFRQRQESKENPEATASQGQGGDGNAEADDTEQEPKQQEEQQQEEPGLSQAVAPQPRRRRPRIQYKFTERQLQELESVFQEIHYPDIWKRRELAGRIYVAESRIKVSISEKSNLAGQLC
ncbi:Paired mesoderm homeobox protein 2B [Heterocephalus glaber]|uniref:Paired mesoderm homeobox protein 2B n=1 Tax=Heterocephalus glaber TaxID=10181 RepID=G5APF6_HETGA|nr:Paired mesoderm homeobox protein 2B [Heterocephalus glaber]